MEVVTLFFIGIYCLYWIIMDVFFWKKDDWKMEEHSETPECSIVICAYNEEKQIGKCLRSLLIQKGIEQYAEIILVNDASVDKTETIAKEILGSTSNIKYRIINHHEKLGKKRCIEKSVELSSENSEYIVLRDADTYVTHNEWLLKMLKEMKKCDLLLAPVINEYYRKNYLSQLQFFEGMALMHLTHASVQLNRPILGNAANMAFKKSVFKKLNPYEGNYHIFSGDDIFLINKFYLSKRIIHSAFTHEHIVYTYSPENLSQIFKQKIRWLSKMNSVKSFFNIISAVIIGVSNLMLFLILFFSIKVFIIFFLVKILIDLKVIYSVKKKLGIAYFSSEKFLIAELLYIPYVCALIFKYFYSKIRK